MSFRKYNDDYQLVINNKMTKMLITTHLFYFLCVDPRDHIYDSVEKFVDGEVVYIDKLDGIKKVQVGYERVEIDLLEAGRIPASQIRMTKATKTVIECPDFTEPGNRRVIDSICSWVNVTGLTQLKNYELTIYTEDEFGNRSLPMKTSVKPSTEENLNSIEITPPSISASSSSAQIEWLEGYIGGDASGVQLRMAIYQQGWRCNSRRGRGRRGGDFFGKYSVGNRRACNADVQDCPDNLQPRLYLHADHRHC
jgi:hypothetical protein